MAHIARKRLKQLGPVLSLPNLIGQQMAHIARKRLFGHSGETMFQCACPVPYKGHMSSSLTEVWLWENAQPRLNLPAVRICYNGCFPYRGSNLFKSYKSTCICMSSLLKNVSMGNKCANERRSHVQDDVKPHILCLLKCTFFRPLWNIDRRIKHKFGNFIQSTLVISNSKGLSEILRDIRSSTYQVCRIEEKIIWLTTFNKLIGNWTFEVRDILKILWKRGEIAP